MITIHRAFVTPTNWKNILGRIVFKFYPVTKRYTIFYHWVLGLTYFIPICCIKQWVEDHKNRSNATVQRGYLCRGTPYIKCDHCLTKGK